MPTPQECVPPYVISLGPLEMVGRWPLNRYGGEKMSMLRLNALSLGFPPVTATRPSGSRTASLS